MKDQKALNFCLIFLLFYFLYAYIYSHGTTNVFQNFQGKNIITYFPRQIQKPLRLASKFGL